MAAAGKDKDKMATAKGTGALGGDEKAPLPSLLRILTLRRDLIWRLALGFIRINGASLPAFSIVLGKIISTLYEDSSTIRSNISKYALIFVGLGVLSLVCSYISTQMFMYFGAKVTRELRNQYYRALLRQEVAWYDKVKTGMILSRMSSDAQIVQDGISQKLAMVGFNVGQIIVGIGIAFYFGWKLTLVLLAISPLFALGGIAEQQSQKSSTSSKQDKITIATQIALEVSQNFRTVLAFVSRQLEMNRFMAELMQITRRGVRQGHATAFFIAFGQLMIFGSYSIGMWYGGTLVARGEMDPGDLLTVFFTIVIIGMSVGQAMDLVPEMVKARFASSEIFYVIDRVPLIDPHVGTGVQKDIVGDIELRNVTFTYPSRPDQVVLKDFSLKITAGQKIAFVGASGSGKSTVVALIERFYDPQQGEVLIDGTNVKEYDLEHLRRKIGIVSQEPILFSCSIADNIRNGQPEASAEEIVQAAKDANAHTFITGQPKGYRTLVGEKGSQLSGGQKQRVAIARAVLKNPKVLLLDEATSALDNESEHLVQEALEKLMKGRTSIVVAHRLSTIRDADVIVVVDKGRVVEMGRHEELVARRGAYETLVRRQLVPGKTAVKLLTEPVAPI